MDTKMKISREKAILTVMKEERIGGWCVRKEEV
jgi:hypothetical protein